VLQCVEYVMLGMVRGWIDDMILLCVALCCTVLHCVAECCRVLQSVAEC